MSGNFGNLSLGLGGNAALPLTIATGGNTIATDGDHKVHTFTSSGTFTPNGIGTVEYLVIAGGGGAGFNYGGAGGYRTATGLEVSSQAYTITVGAGGAGTTGASNNGSDSIFSTITSTGGGGGGGNTGNDGGSGGGGGTGSSKAGGSGNTPATTPSQGNDGGTSNANGGASGGGGAGGGGANHTG